MSRRLLHKSCLDEFKAWLTESGIEWREPRGQWQVLQVKVKDKFSPWQCVFDRMNAQEHYTVALPLESTVREFINSRKKS